MPMPMPTQELSASSPTLAATVTAFTHFLPKLISQELRDTYRAKLEEMAQYTRQYEVVVKEEKPQLEASKIMPVYMLKLTGGYEYRTYCTCHIEKSSNPGHLLFHLPPLIILSCVRTSPRAGFELFETIRKVMLGLEFRVRQLGLGGPFWTIRKV